MMVAPTLQLSDSYNGYIKPDEKEVKLKTNPQTGDNVYGKVYILGGSGFIVYILYRRKRNYENRNTSKKL